MKKKLLVLCVISSILLVSGCGNKQEKINAKMEEYTKEYYETYIKGSVIGLDVPEISLKDLKSAVNAGAKYELDIFKKCTDTSYATLTLDDNGDVTKVDFHMNCK